MLSRGGHSWARERATSLRRTLKVVRHGRTRKTCVTSAGLWSGHLVAAELSTEYPKSPAQLQDAVEDDLRLFAERSDHTEVSLVSLFPSRPLKCLFEMTNYRCRGSF